MEQSAGTQAPEPPTSDAPTTVTTTPAAPAPPRAALDPDASEPPRTLYARMKLFFFRTTLGRTRRDKSDV